LRSHIFVSFHPITLKLGNFTDFKAVFPVFGPYLVFPVFGGIWSIPKAVIIRFSKRSLSTFKYLYEASNKNTTQ